jgi:cobalt-zinc-cadmium efflux system outer membrane protein
MTVEFRGPFRGSKKPTATRFFGAALAALVGATCTLVASRAGAGGSLGEEDATRRFCESGPAFAIATAERLRGEAEVTAAGVLPNPSLVVEHQRTFRGLDERETIVGLSIPLGIGGRRFLLQDAADARRDQARADAEATLFESALAFREAYARAVAEQARAEVFAEQQTALERLNSTIQGLTKGGEAAGYDLLRQQAQARRHRALLETARGRALAARTLLEAWLDGGVVPASEQGLAGVPDSRLAGEIRTPALRSLEASARASSLEARAARRRWVPDLDVFAGYRAVSATNDTGHGMSLGLTLPITFFDHGQGEASRAEAERDLALARAGTLRREQRAAVKAARLKLGALGTALAETEKASTDAAAIQAKAMQLYAAGEATITELLEAFRIAEELRLARLDVIEEIAHARLTLMRAAGTMFDPALDRVCRNDLRGAP